MSEQTKIPTWLAKLFVVAVLGLQSWALVEIVSLKQTVAGLAARVDLIAGVHIANK